MKAQAILVMLHQPLRAMPPDVLETVKWFLFEFCKGANAENDRRWHRFWSRLYHTQQSRPVIQGYFVTERSAGFHKRWMAIEGRLFESQDHFFHKEGMRLWLKAGAAFGEYEMCQGVGTCFKPSSLAWEDCSDDEMREFTENALAFLRTPYALATLWPDTREHERLEQLECCMRNPKEEDPTNDHEPARAAG